MALSDLARWRGRLLAPPLVLDQVDSTNAEALRRAHALPPGTCLPIGARHQTEGRGSQGRRWQDQPDRSLLLSILLTAPLPRLPPLAATVLGALAAGDAALALGVRGVTAKWPNDVLAGGRKLAGVLTESVSRAHALAALVIGVGLNVDQGAEDFLGSYRTPPTSLRLELGRPVGVATAGALVLDAVDRRLETVAREGPTGLWSEWHARLELPEGRVVVETVRGARRGRLQGFDEDGSLLLEEARSRVRIPGGHVLALSPEPLA